MLWLEITLSVLAIIGGIVVYAQYRYENGISKYSPKYSEKTKNLAKSSELIK